MQVIAMFNNGTTLLHIGLYGKRKTNHSKISSFSKIIRSVEVTLAFQQKKNCVCYSMDLPVVIRPNVSHIKFTI